MKMRVKVLGNSATLTMLACAALALTACAATSSSVRVDKAEQQATCESFEWLSQTNEPASFTEQRVRTAALAELERKGYAISSDKADCRIAYVLSTSERPEQKPRVGVGAGGGSGGLGGGIGISLPIGKRARQAGTFTLDIVDARQNAQVWSGSLDVGFAAAEPTEEEFGEAVREILSQFPDREASR